MMSSWNGSRVLIIGAARQGVALARYLAERNAKVVLNDRLPESELSSSRQALENLDIEWVCGGHPDWLLDKTELLCLSGGVPLDLPLVVRARNLGIPLTNDSQIFLEEAPCKVIGITGSAGKSTTTSLVGQIAHSAIHMKSESIGVNHTIRKETYVTTDVKEYRRAWVGGNIGSPLISFIDEIQANDLVVMELSSFQLEIMSKSPQIAAILNITPNHLDRHKNMAAYVAAKMNILIHQRPGDLAVLNRDDQGSLASASMVKGSMVSFGRNQPPADEIGTYLADEHLFLRSANRDWEIMPKEMVPMRGKHNLLNVLAACVIAYIVGLPIPAMCEGVTNFKGLPHRLEFIRRWQEADWYNDSIATAPERSIAAIQAFHEPLILLAGGRDKNLPWEEFASLVNKRVKHLILFGEARGKIKEIVINNSHQATPTTKNYLPVIHDVSNLKAAVLEAADLVHNGDVVLLAPGGTSFDEFRDFEDRGEAFRKWVMELQ